MVEREPLDDDLIRRHPQVLLTPHAAFYSVEGYVEMRTQGGGKSVTDFGGRSGAKSGEFALFDGGEVRGEGNERDVRL